jgi:hypothetical protein
MTKSTSRSNEVFAELSGKELIESTAFKANPSAILAA